MGVTCCAVADAGEGFVLRWRGIGGRRRCLGLMDLILEGITVFLLGL